MDKCNCIHTILASRTEKPKLAATEMMAVHSKSGQWDAEAGLRDNSRCMFFCAVFQARPGKAEDVMPSLPIAANRQCGPTEVENQK